MNDPTALDTTGSLGCGDCSGDAGGDVHRSRQVSVPYYVKALAMALPAFCFGLTLRGWIDFLSHIPSGRTDFRHLYATAYMVRTGHGSEIYSYLAQKLFQNRLISPANLALPFNHLAYESLIFLPFSYLSYTHAYLLWLGLNLLMLGICFFLLRSDLEPLRSAWLWLPIAAFVGFIPLSAAMEQGQDSILLLTLLTVAYVSLRSGKELIAGLVLGMGMFKFQLVLPIVALFLLWRKWRVVAGFTMAALTCISMSIVITGVEHFRDYGTMLMSMSSGLTDELQTLYGVPPAQMANLRGLIFMLTDGHFSSLSQTIQILSASLLVVFITARFGPTESSDQLLLGVIVASLVSYHFLLHDMSILFLPIAVMLSTNIEAETEGKGCRKWLFRSSAFLFAAMAWRMFPATIFFLMCVPLALFWICSLSAGAARRSDCVVRSAAASFASVA